LCDEQRNFAKIWGVSGFYKILRVAAIDAQLKTNKKRGYPLANSQIISPVSVSTTWALGQLYGLSVILSAW
jgi:hypothetical protein